MIKALFFDFWGTLVENGVWSPSKQVKNILQINLPFSEYIVRMEKAMMTQKFNSLKDAFENVCKEFNIECTEAGMEQLIGMWNKSWMLATPYTEVCSILEKLSKRYSLILVSNTDCFSAKNALQKHDLEKYFKKIYFSCDLGLIKTEPLFFKKLLQDLKLNSEQCVMIGDSIQSDITPAKSIGMNVILVDRKDTRDFKPKINNLQQLERYLE